MWKGEMRVLVVDGFWGRSGTLWIGGRLMERFLRMI